MFKNPAALKAAAEGDMLNALVASTPGGIERQEKAGQTALVNSTNMPKEMHPSREAFEKIGFKFGADVDELFVQAELPTGWTRRPTDHAMHSEIVDDKGRVRVSVFYKAAFYDRRADASLKPRFSLRTLYDSDPGVEKGTKVMTLCDGGVEIKRFPPIAYRDWDAEEAQRQAAVADLEKERPDFRDPTAYWTAA